MSGRRRRRVLALTVLIGITASADPGTEPTGAAAFDTARVRFEQNATDGDVEVVFEIKGGDEGLTRLVVIAPDGRTVADFTAPDASTLGIRQFELESPEPRDVAKLKAAYPEGLYAFSASTPGGGALRGTARLSHALPPTAEILGPGEAPVSLADPRITWAARDDVAAWIVEIEQDDLHVNLTAKLPGAASAFGIPRDFLRPGTEYDLAIGSVSERGNISYVETSFTTPD